MANLFGQRTKEKALYAAYVAYQRAKDKRERTIWHLRKAGVSFKEIPANPEYQKVSQECSKAYQKWDECRYKIMVRKE